MGALAVYGDVMGWFTSKKLCVHCNQNKTSNKFENFDTCTECEKKILMSREGIRICPVDQAKMVKEDHQGIIIDRCEKCNGVWLDNNELKSMQELAQQDSDIATGVVLGMLI